MVVRRATGTETTERGLLTTRRAVATKSPKEAAILGAGSAATASVAAAGAVATIGDPRATTSTQVAAVEIGVVDILKNTNRVALLPQNKKIPKSKRLEKRRKIAADLRNSKKREKEERRKHALVKL